MDQTTKMLLARILGEVCRVQRRLDPEMSGRGAQTIYGLLNGIETVLDSEFELDNGQGGNWISRDQVSAMVAILQALDEDPPRKKAFKGYYDIQEEVAAAGLTLALAIPILTYLKAGGGFVDLIDKMGTEHSPFQGYKFELARYEE